MRARWKERVGRGGRLPLEVFLRRRRRRLSAAGTLAVVVLAALAVADRRGWLISDEEWGKYHGRSFKVGRVVDGDTLDVDVPDGGRERTRVRLWGIDTPEMKARGARVEEEGSAAGAGAGGSEEGGPEEWAVEATGMARELAEGQRVTLELQTQEVRDRYGRLLAYVRLPSGQYLNEQLLLAGLARADRRFAHDRMEQYVLLEGEAKRQRLGMWSKRAGEE